jgi:hypothetical protein
MARPTWIRVKDRTTKHEYSVVASAVNEDAHTVLDKPGADVDGTPLPPKHYKPLSNKSGPKAETPEKES